MKVLSQPLLAGEYTEQLTGAIDWPNYFCRGHRFQASYDHPFRFKEYIGYGFIANIFVQRRSLIYIIHLPKTINRLPDFC
jgi:hypothetical protein